MDKKLLEKPENYYNREMSWLQFNYRILNEAKDKSIPLFERLNFLSITESNLSEFFMVRVASLIDLVHADVKKKDIAGLTPQGQLDLIIPETKNMIASQYSTLNRQILPALEENGLKLVKNYEDLNEKQSKFVDKYFEKEVYPVLTPMAVDSSRPFPLISNKTFLEAAAGILAVEAYHAGLIRATLQARGTIDPTVFSDQYPLNCSQYDGAADGQTEFMEESRVGMCDLIRCLKQFVAAEHMECDFSAFDFVNF